MTYDIGIGRCSGINDDSVVVELDSVVVKKLTPERPWRKSGSSLLRCDLRLCSPRRPPRLNEELYLDSAALSRKAPALLDLERDGNFKSVDLKLILSGLDPMPAPSPQPKNASYRSVRGRK
ncbi:MAG TPA: hypothetical protein VGC30_13385 [Dokdonella sp.]